MIIQAEVSPYDPVTGARVLLRVTSHNTPEATGIGDFVWRPAISQMPSIAIRLFSGDFDGQATPSGGNITLQMQPLLKLYANARRLNWSGAPIKLYAGNSGDAWPWTTVFQGTVNLQELKDNALSLSMATNPLPFSVDALTLKYAGTGGAEGGTDLASRLKPFLLGYCRVVEPVKIDEVNNVFQVSGYGPIQAIRNVYERGSRFDHQTPDPSPATTSSPTPVVDYPTYAALIAATIPGGHYATCLAQGMFRLGYPNFGLITADVDGDVYGSVYRRKTGEIILRVAASAGVNTADIDTSSFTAIDTALGSLPNQGRVGVYLTDQETVIDLASRLAAPCNAQVGISLLGKMFARRISYGAALFTLDAQRRELPKVAYQPEEVGTSPPWSFMEFGYAKCWRVHTEDEIAIIDNSLVTEEAIADAATQAEWTNVAARPVELTDGRITAGLDSNGLLQQHLPPSIGSAQSSSVIRPLARGTSIVEVRDGEYYTFPTPWGSGQIPTVRPFITGFNDPTNYLDCKALDVTAAGFLPDCKRVSPGTLTAQSATTAGTATSPRALEIVKSLAEEAHDDMYKFLFNVAITNVLEEPGLYSPGEATIGLWSHDGATWQLNNTMSVYGSGGSAASTTRTGLTGTIARDGMGLNDRFGLSVESSTGGASITAFASVTYKTSSGNTITSATPTNFPGINFMIVGGTE